MYLGQQTKADDTKPFLVFTCPQKKKKINNAVTGFQFSVGGFTLMTA